MTRYDYNSLKQLAITLGTRVPDLLALSPKNDPFYVGTPAVITKGEWFASIYQRAGYSIYRPPHLRRVHYWTVSQKVPVLMPNGEPYENTEKCWDFIVDAGKAARYLGLVALNGIVDNKNPQPHVHAYYDHDEPSVGINIPKLDAPGIFIHGIEDADAQPYHLEVWCEKSTMNDVLLPVCRTYNANLVTFEGEVSITSVCVSLMQRIQDSGNKPTRIWYISDFDPAGNSMPVAMSRKLEYSVQQSDYDLDVRVRPLALTMEQAQEYELPRIPIKESEKRAAKFESAFGGGAVELDALEALHPGELENIVDGALSAYYDADAAQEVEDQQEALRAAVQAKIDVIVAKYKPQIAALEAMQDELRQITVNARAHKVERYEPSVYEDDDWLFNSQRDYLDQISAYKAHKGIESEL